MAALVVQDDADDATLLANTRKSSRLGDGMVLLASAQAPRERLDVILRSADFLLSAPAKKVLANDQEKK